MAEVVGYLGLPASSPHASLENKTTYLKTYDWTEYPENVKFVNREDCTNSTL